MKKKTAVITGASSGFGFLTTIELAKEGFYVLATMRDLSKREKLVETLTDLGLQDYVDFQRLDVTKEQSIQEFGSILEGFEQITLLVNNAGFALGGFAEEVTVEEYRKQFDTNFFGLIAVTKAVLPHMRKQQYGKIINIGSISGQIGFPGLSPYVSSKYALEGFSECLRLEVNPFGIDVVLIEPGSYNTNIWTTGKQIAQKSLHIESPYNPMMEKVEREIAKGQSSLGDPMDVVRLICSIATKKSKTTKLRYSIGKGVKASIFLKNCLPWRLWEIIVLKRLFK
ncbi:oxidoreductase [Cytobacillus sp. S13-E01]|uniref:oxidoreductase n=1 Tax=Cytobacillus sp. S13-E01 TaxID=3031326 RepID=UPI0023D80F46|nr:oxidoreductase [Cytobacillus sp. S13-E01]MDF0727403.1 oxidoreductase [Cytobacillus sp. S13-E01]